MIIFFSGLRDLRANVGKVWPQYEPVQKELCKEALGTAEYEIELLTIWHYSVGMLFGRGERLGPSWGLGSLNVSGCFSWSEISDGQRGSQFMVNRYEVRLFKLCKTDGLLMVKNLQEVVLKELIISCWKMTLLSFPWAQEKQLQKERDYGKERNIRVAIIPTPTKVRIIFFLWGLFSSVAGVGILSSTTWHENPLICQHSVRYTAQTSTWMVLGPQVSCQPINTVLPI